MNNKKKYIFISILIAGICTLLTIVGTYAWYNWSTTSENTTKISTTLGAAEVYFDGGGNISKGLKPTATKEEGIVKTIEVKGSTSGLTFNLYLDINSLDNNLKQSSFKYELYKGTTLKTSGNFVNPTVVPCPVNSGKNHIELLKDEPISTSKQQYKLYIWIDGNMSNPVSMAGKPFSFNMHASGQNAIIKEGKIPDLGNYPENLKNTLAYQIMNTYVNAPKTEAMNNGKKYFYYEQVPAESDTVGTSGLMSDLWGNVRYYGANPNNHINLLNKAGGKDRYRIIGVFRNVRVADGTTKDLVKVIRDESIGSYSWDTSASTVNSGYGVNQWGNTSSYEGADLMRLLNPGYSGINGSLWWNGTSGNCYNNSNNANGACNFASTGLNPSIQSKIESVTWHMGGGSSPGIYSDDAYIMERGDKVGSSSSDKISRTSTWTGKVALMSPSDYGYAVNFNSCTNNNLNNYEGGNCPANNWLKNGSYQWLLAPYSSDAYSVWLVFSSGTVYSNYYYAYRARGVRPVFYLSSELSVVSGDGSSGAPYEIK